MTPAILIIYGVMSFVTFAVYARDKSLARSGGWRIPEKFLHLLELLGGWPGGIAARRVLRHKTQKLAFKVVSWVIVMLHLAAVGLWYLKPGR